MTPVSTPQRRRHRPAGFTLLELIVAVGAVALIAVGVAAVFESVGRTVSGGRRVSQLNQFAALVERQMRVDFENMTRDGVLVIRHQYAIDREPVALHEEDVGPRPRRTDEIIFMTRGDLSSARSPVLPGIRAQASEGIVHYGHGIRFNSIRDLPGKDVQERDPRYDRPHVADGREFQRSFRDGNELGSDFNEDNPNRYAAYWTLLRRVTLLAPPTSTDPNLPFDSQYWNTLGIDRTDAFDNEIQIGGQPASASAFRSIARHFINGQFATIRGATQDPATWAPMLSSGIVDIATSDMAEIRRIVMDAGEFANVVRDIRNPFQAQALFDPAGGTYLLDNQQSASLNLGDPTNNLLHMHSWMEDLFPTDTDTLPNHLPQRPRYEDRVPDFTGTLTNYDYSSNDDEGRTRQSIRLGDQRMLSSSVFAPHCSEFIVEYSFGQRNTDNTSAGYGETIWYGMHRDVDVDGSIPVVRPYPFYEDPYEGGAPQNYTYVQNYALLDGGVGSRILSPALIYGVPNSDQPSRNKLVAHFGYTDPVYSPSSSNDPQTIPWQWPLMIRVTVTLADPADPDTEETFQFIFETPDGKVF